MSKLYRIDGKVVNDIETKALIEDKYWNNSVVSKDGITSSPTYAKSEGNVFAGELKTLFEVNDYGFAQIFVTIQKIGVEIAGILRVSNPDVPEDSKFFEDWYITPIGFAGSWNTGQADVFELWAPVKPGSKVRLEMIGGSYCNYDAYMRIHNASTFNEDSSSKIERNSVKYFGGKVVNNINIQEHKKDGWGMLKSTNRTALQSSIQTDRTTPEIISLGLTSHKYVVEEDGYAECQAFATGVLEFTAELFITIKDTNGDVVARWTTSRQHYFVSPQFYTMSGILGAEVKKGYEITYSVRGLSADGIYAQTFVYPSYYNLADKKEDVIEGRTFKLNDYVVNNGTIEMYDEEKEQWGPLTSTANRHIHTTPHVMWDEKPIVVGTSGESYTIETDGYLYAKGIVNCLMEFYSQIHLWVEDENGVNQFGTYKANEITGLRPDYGSIGAVIGGVVKKGWKVKIRSLGVSGVGHLGIFFKVDPTFIKLVDQ